MANTYELNFAISSAECTYTNAERVNSFVVTYSNCGKPRQCRLPTTCSTSKCLSWVSTERWDNDQATGLKSNKRWFDPQQGQEIYLFSSPHRLWRPHGLLFNGYLGIKRAGREADHSPPSSAAVKREWCPHAFHVCTRTFPSSLSARPPVTQSRKQLRKWKCVCCCFYGKTNLRQPIQALSHVCGHALQTGGNHNVKRFRQEFETVGVLQIPKRCGIEFVWILGW